MASSKRANGRTFGNCSGNVMSRANLITKVPKRCCSPNAVKLVPILYACWNGWSRWGPRFGKLKGSLSCGRSAPNNRVCHSDILFCHLHRRPLRFRREPERLYLCWSRRDRRNRSRRPSWTVSQPIWREAVGVGWSGLVSDQYFQPPANGTDFDIAPHRGRHRGGERTGQSHHERIAFADG